MPVLFKPLKDVTYRIHPLVNGDQELRIMGSGSPGMCVPPQLYYALPLFNYNTNQVEVYVTKELMSDRAELLGKLFGTTKKSKWRNYDYKLRLVSSYDDVSVIQSETVWLDEEVEIPSYSELKLIVAEYEEALKEEQYQQWVKEQPCQDQE